MEFQNPTTKAQMLETVKDIFAFYRASAPIYEEADLVDMLIPSVEYTPKTNSACLNEASELLLVKLTREKIDYVAELTKEVERLNAENVEALIKRNMTVEAIDEEYTRLKKEYKSQAIEKGISVSQIALSGINEIEGKRQAEIVKAQSEYDAKVQNNTTLKEIAEQKIANVERYFSEIHQLEVETKAKEIKLEDERFVLEIEKYNNSVYEKNVKYQNALVQAKANLELKFMEVRKDYSKDELIVKGYYKDVLRCVTAYYDTLSASDAYIDLNRETELMLYLEEYYSYVVEIYRARAALEISSGV